MKYLLSMTDQQLIDKANDCIKWEDLDLMLRLAEKENRPKALIERLTQRAKWVYHYYEETN